MYYVYVLKRAPGGTHYVGFTKDLRGRIKKHESRQKVKLEYYEAYPTEKLARLRELQLKQYGGSWRSLRKRLGI